MTDEEESRHRSAFLTEEQAAALFADMNEVIRVEARRCGGCAAR